VQSGLPRRRRVATCAFLLSISHSPIREPRRRCHGILEFRSADSPPILVRAAYRDTESGQILNACIRSRTPRCCVNSRAIWDHTVLPACHPAEVTFPPLPQPIKAGTRFMDHKSIKG